MRESAYERHVIARARREFPGCEITKNDSSLIQGIPDRTIFFGPHWAMLEIKVSAQAPIQPNQLYYIRKMNRLSYAAIIFPENEDEVFRDLHVALEPCR